MTQFVSTNGIYSEITNITIQVQTDRRWQTSQTDGRWQTSSCCNTVAASSRPPWSCPPWRYTAPTSSTPCRPTTSLTLLSVFTPRALPLFQRRRSRGCGPRWRRGSPQCWRTRSWPSWGRSWTSRHSRSAWLCGTSRWSGRTPSCRARCWWDSRGRAACSTCPPRSTRPATSHCPSSNPSRTSSSPAYEPRSPSRPPCWSPWPRSWTWSWRSRETLQDCPASALRTKNLSGARSRSWSPSRWVFWALCLEWLAGRRYRGRGRGLGSYCLLSPVYRVTAGPVRSGEFIWSTRQATAPTVWHCVAMASTTRLSAEF